jgi:type IV pilus assembly protein PilO
MQLPSFLKRKSAAERIAEREAAKAAGAVEAAPKKPLIDFKQLADDFKTLDPKDPGLWPVAPRAVVLLGLFAALIGGAWWFGWNVQVEELAVKQNEEETLKNEWVTKKRMAVNLDEHKAQLVAIDASFGALLKQLPNQTEMPGLLVDVHKTATSRGLLVELFKPGGEVRKDFYAEVPITLHLTGSYHDVGAFAGDVAQLSRIVTLNEIDVTSGAGSVLSLKTTAKTFYFLDPDEIAKTRKAGGGKK